MEQEIYVLLKIFSYTEHDTFWKLRILNKFFSRILLNKCNSEDIEKYGNISSDFYLMRLQNWFSPKLIEIKPEVLSNINYYKICHIHYNNKHDNKYIDKLCLHNKLLQLQMLELFGIYPKVKHLNQVCSYGFMRIIKHFAPHVLPDYFGATAAKVAGHQHILKFLKEYGIRAPNNLHMGEAVCSGTNNTLVGSSHAASGK